MDGGLCLAHFQFTEGELDYGSGSFSVSISTHWGTVSPSSYGVTILSKCQLIPITDVVTMVQWFTICVRKKGLSSTRIMFSIDITIVSSNSHWQSQWMFAAIFHHYRDTSYLPRYLKARVRGDGARVCVGEG